MLVLTGAWALAFFYAPQAERGVVPRAFYLHVRLAIVAPGGLGAGRVFALVPLR